MYLDDVSSESLIGTIIGVSCNNLTHTSIMLVALKQAQVSRPDFALLLSHCEAKLGIHVPSTSPDTDSSGMGDNQAQRRPCSNSVLPFYRTIIISTDRLDFVVLHASSVK